MIQTLLLPLKFLFSCFRDRNKTKLDKIGYRYITKQKKIGFMDRYKEADYAAKW